MVPFHLPLAIGWLLVRVSFVGAGSYLFSLLLKEKHLLGSSRHGQHTSGTNDEVGTHDPPWDMPFPLTSEKYERPCSTPEAMQWKYCDTSLSDSDRMSWLIDNLSPEEKISLLGNKVPAVPRLSLPPYNWWSEALHGVSSTCCPGIRFKSTSFPQVCTTGASFNRSLFAAIGDAIGTEAIEHYSRLDDVPGLTYWAPNVNLFRDPRWGRGQEVPGEDPYLNGEYAASLIPAMQYGKDGKGRGNGLPRIAAACKHFAAYSIETGRMAFDAKVDERDMEESYLPMFEKCAESGVLGFMCSYNAVNGIPSCANSALLISKLREEWGFDGYVTGDCGAVGNIHASHKYTDSMEAGIAAALKSGVDSDCGGDIQSHGMAALNASYMSMQDIDRALTNLFGVQFQLGYYNPAIMSTQKYSKLELRRRLDDDQVHMHNDLALEAARQGIVLLKNGQEDASPTSQRPLPLSQEKHPTVALFGPNADATYTMLGNYFGQPPLFVSPKQGLKNLEVDVAYFKGCNITGTSLLNVDDICRAATTSDATVLVMGNDEGIENEGRDRTTISLPGKGQGKLIGLASACAKREADKPVILVILSGGPIDISQFDKNIDGILYVGYPGQAGGTAIAEAIYGKYSPSGRLATTIYPAEYTEQVDIRDMRMRPSDGFPGRTHRYYTGKTVYPFGYGMSYSAFERVITLSDGDGDIPTEVNIEVWNKGPMKSAHSILLFHSGPQAGREGNPIRSLVAFEKLLLGVRETSNVVFSIDSELMKEPGLHRLTLGPNNEGEENVHEIMIQK